MIVAGKTYSDAATLSSTLGRISTRENSMGKVRAWAAAGSRSGLEPYQYEPEALGADDVEIAVEHCGLCYSDLAVIGSEWSPTTYPVVPGHEVVGRIIAVGSNVKALRVDDRVGVGWYAGSCDHCRTCLRGDHNLCANRLPTIVGRHGGFAERLRVHSTWAIPLPPGLEPRDSAPLMCAGVTVFNPLLLHGVRPIDRVGIAGIGGLGHLAVKFARAWGCHVTAITSNPSKREDAAAFGAHRTIISTDPDDMKSAAGSIDFLLATRRNAPDWSTLIELLAPKGRMHQVGVSVEPMAVTVRPHLIAWQRSLSGSSTGSPATLLAMLDFAARHRVLPQVEHFAMSRVNDAIGHMRSGKARYRIVLDADFA